MTEEEFWAGEEYDYVAKDTGGVWFSYPTAPEMEDFVWDVKGDQLRCASSVPQEWKDLGWKDSLKIRPPKASSAPVVENAGNPIVDLINKIQGISDEKSRKATESAVAAARYPESDTFFVEAQRQVAQSDAASEVIAECIEKIKKHFDI